MSTRPILLLLGEDRRLLPALAAELGRRGLPHRIAPAGAGGDELFDLAFGSRALVLTGDRLADALPLAQLPGIELVVVVAGPEVDLTRLRRSGCPYVVLRPAPLADDLLAELRPTLAHSSRWLAPDDERTIRWVAAEDVAGLAVAALSADDVQGRVFAAVAPAPAGASQLLAEAAAALGGRLRQAPAWALRLLGKKPPTLPDALLGAAESHPPATWLDRPWTGLGEALRVAAAREQQPSRASG